jgi:hypothetical protein
MEKLAFSSALSKSFVRHFRYKYLTNDFAKLTKKPAFSKEKFLLFSDENLAKSYEKADKNPFVKLFSFSYDFAMRTKNFPYKTFKKKNNGLKVTPHF